MHNTNLLHIRPGNNEIRNINDVHCVSRRRRRRCRCHFGCFDYNQFDGQQNMFEPFEVGYSHNKISIIMIDL